ncbi:MAG: hypothetical protein ACKOED_09265 [Aestuariivirga sp.]|uniref:hypothetical protein n=1 Tax=Aestuariivirga sp. TaxID=2650926 RepID=UPI0038CFE9BF
MGFFMLKSASVADQAKTGNAIIRLSKSVFKQGPASEWAKFNKDIRKWLYDAGYRYDGSADGRVPAHVDIVPVYDTEHRIHVRIPWAGDLKKPPKPPDETYAASFPVFLARYFMRKCR